MKWAAAVCGADPAILLRYFCRPLRGLEIFRRLEPGAYAPGFMLAPAPQAKSRLSGKASFLLFTLFIVFRWYRDRRLYEP